MEGWVLFILQLQCSSYYYPGSGSYSLDLICPTKGNAPVLSASLTTHFDNGVRTQSKPFSFCGSRYKRPHDGKLS